MCNFYHQEMCPSYKLISKRKKIRKEEKVAFQLEVNRFTEITVHRGSVVTIRFTILFLRVSIRFDSLKCKQKLSVNCQLDW